MTDDFAKRVATVSSRADFQVVVQQTLKTLLGESVALALVYHLGEEALQDPEMLDKRLHALFDRGADVILKHILENLSGYVEWEDKRLN